MVSVTQVCSHLTSALSVPPAQSWVSTFLSSQKPTTPLPSLLATAKVRLLNAEITNAFAPSTALPSDIHDATLKERRMQGPIVVQVLDVSDMTRSLWSQVEAIEAAERGEGKKGREVIRVVVSDQSSETLESTAFEGGMHKLLLQDAKGVRVFGLELKKVKGLRLGMNIGTKLVLRNVTVARGTLLLEPETTTILGGKIDSLHKTWVEDRKANLKAAIAAQRGEGGA